MFNKQEKPITAVSNYKVEGRVSTINDMMEYLSDLESVNVNPSISAQAALQSQMLVVRSVSSPKLLDSIFDTLIFNMQKSLDDMPVSTQKRIRRYIS